MVQHNQISVVIPVYGCKATLTELCSRIVKTVSTISDNFEIILVNDNCPQGSWDIITKLCAKDVRIKGIQLARNFGQINAITAGLDASAGDWVIVMDCDLQDRPEEILTLYTKAQEGYDAVFAKRKNRKDSFFKIFISKFFYKIYSLISDGYYNPATSNFSVVSRKMVDNYCNMRELHRAYVIYMKWLGFKQIDIFVEHDARKEGKSSYNFKKRVKLAFDILLSQSDKLLKFSMGVGFVLTFLSFIALIFLLVNYFRGNVMPGWTSTIAIMTFLGGMIISSIGIVGVYIGKIFMQSKNRPLYVIRTLLNGKK